MKAQHLVERYGFCPVTEPAKRKRMIELIKRKVPTVTDLEEKREWLVKLKQLKRIDRAENDVLFFMYQYLGAEMNPEFEEPLIPKGVSIDMAPDFHIQLTDILNVVSNEEVNKRIAWAAPRGHAKSAYLSNAFPLHQCVYQKRKYILIISETDSMSKKFIEYVANALKFNKLLREDFGELLSPKSQMNERDNQEAFLTKAGTLVEASSMGKQMRGKRNGAYRPDLVICDDLESSKNTNTAELRDKNLHWFNSVVMPIGDPDRTAFIYMGTAVHQSGLLFEVMRRSDFQSKLFSAIISPPERQDLWDMFDELLRDQTNPNRKETALAFYEMNREEMDKGVEVLWEQRWSYLGLMIEKSNMTSKAFASEYLNVPIDEDSQTFSKDRMVFWDYGELDDLNLEIYGAWDMAFGKSNRSDYNAVVILGRERRTGVLYVLHTWAEKCPAHKAMEKALEIIKEYQPRVFAVETVQGQFDLYRQLREQMMKDRVYMTKLKPITTNRSHGKKEERIEQMEPLFENGVIRPHQAQRLLLEQLEMFPFGDHDDLPDALQMALDLCSLQTRKSWARKPAGL
ncbi:phage terminase large subunit [Neobacillus rhizosphaerae]|uniref:phage terminase large subunit n=1 Tax=Neobacillus rhizosphaerae TaxID=2880965 RepID=UPI003D29E8AB